MKWGHHLVQLCTVLAICCKFSRKLQPAKLDLSNLAMTKFGSGFFSALSGCNWLVTGALVHWYMLWVGTGVWRLGLINVWRESKRSFAGWGEFFCKSFKGLGVVRTSALIFFCVPADVVSLELKELAGQGVGSICFVFTKKHLLSCIHTTLVWQFKVGDQCCYSLSVVRMLVAINDICSCRGCRTWSSQHASIHEWKPKYTWLDEISKLK